MFLAASCLDEQLASLQLHHGVVPGSEEDGDLHAGDEGRGGGVVMVTDGQVDLVVGVERGVKLRTVNID